MSSAATEAFVDRVHLWLDDLQLRRVAGQEDAVDDYDLFVALLDWLDVVIFRAELDVWAALGSSL